MPTDMVNPIIGTRGETLEIHLSAGSTIGQEITGTGSFSISALFATAQASISKTVQHSITLSVDYGMSWTVPGWMANGELHAGAERFSFSWGHWHYTWRGSCVDTEFGHGSGTFPDRAPYSWHNATG